MTRITDRGLGWRFLAVWVGAGILFIGLGLAAGVPVLFGLAELGLFGETADLMMGAVLFGFFVGSGLGLGLPVDGRFEYCAYFYSGYCE